MLRVHLDGETIVAIATAPGRGGIGVVRLSGERAREIAAPMLRLRGEMEAGRARFGYLLDGAGADQRSEVLDEVVVTYFAGPRSYTGEDVVEVAAHGSPVVLEAIVRGCLRGGARLAEPGEFTQRAFLSGRLDLPQAEAVNDLIRSTTMYQARTAASQIGGAVSREVQPAKERLLQLMAAMEAGIDFAEDDIDVLPAGSIVGMIDEVSEPLRALERSYAYGRVVRDGFRLAIVGRPNAGKSSLFNALIERERAIVTAAPGTTRDTVTETISMEGVPVELVDTAGLRADADGAARLDEAEVMGIARSRQAMADADVVLLVVDGTVAVHAEDVAILERADGRLLVVRNKSDLFGGMEGERNSGALSDPTHDDEAVMNGAPALPTHDDEAVVNGAPALPTHDDEAVMNGAPALPTHDDETVMNGAPALPTRDDETVMYGAPALPTHDDETVMNGAPALPTRDDETVMNGAPALPTHDDETVMNGAPGLRRGRVEVVETSTKTGAGLAELRAAILAAVRGDGATREGGLLTSLRQHEAIAGALTGLDEARTAVESGLPHEVVLLDLRRGLDGLDALTGTTTSEDILRLIFLSFCIGK